MLGPLYVPAGDPVAAGDRIRNAALAECLRSGGGRRERPCSTPGALGEELIATIAADGGYLSLDDLARHRTAEMALVAGRFAGHVVWELGPPTQGPAVVEALGRIDAARSPSTGRRCSTRCASGCGLPASTRPEIGARPSPARGDTTYVAVIDRRRTRRVADHERVR